MKKIYLLFMMMVLFFASQAQIAVTVSGTAVTTPALAGSYTSLADALTALNAITAYPTPGTIVFTCTAGGSETAPPTGLVIGSASLNPLLSATNTVTIIKASGTVTVNAGVGTASPTSAAPDGMISIRGADYITIDGLTLTDGNVANPATMEFGIGLFKSGVGDGCNNNTIQNCTINMQRINNASSTSPMIEGSVGILVINSTAIAATTSLTPTNGGTLATNGTNSGNRFYTNAINSGNYGIGLSGFAASAGVGPTPTATTFLGDLGNDIGGVGAGTGNTILNYGGGAATNPAAGIRANNQWSVNISYNTVDNNNGAGVNHATTLRGIFAQAGTSGAATISNNTVTVRSGATTSALTAIDNGIGSTAVTSNTININNNTIRFSYTTATSGLFTAISNSASAGTVNINTNNIQQLAATNYPSTGTVLVIVGGSPGGPMNVSNNTISNFVMTGASGTLRVITASTPTGLYTVTGNTIENLSYTTAASTGSITGIYNLASATLENVNNNVIRNFSTPTSGTLNGIQNNTVAGTFQCRNNQIYNFTTTAGGAGGFTANGITWSNANVDISGNIIYSINSAGTTGGTGGTINGITNSGAATINGNAIYDLSSNSTNVVITGILINATGTNTVSNNLIGDLRAPNSTGNISIAGITAASGTTNNIFHNTVNIASTTTSLTTFGTSAIYFGSSTPVNNLRNNVFVNTSAPGPTGGFTAAIRYTIAPTSTNFPAANNNNLYYAGVAAANRVLYCEGSSGAPTNGQQTIANYKTYINTTLPVGGREAASVSEIPNFVSTTGSNPITTFLRYNTGVATQIEQGGGTGTGITTDYAATTRCPGGGCPGATATPDMGAWELNGIAADLTAPSISAISLVGNACGLVTRTLTATISDGTGVDNSATLRPRIYFQKNGGGYFSAQGTLSSGTVNSGSWTFTITYATLGGVIPTDIITYFIVAQDVAAIPNVGGNPSAGLTLTNVNSITTNPTTPLTYTIGSSISGVINVGAAEAPPYNTLTSAINKYNTSCLSGPVTFNLVDATYSVSETFPISINANADASAVNTLTIKPNTTATLTGSVNSGALILLNGADYVTIDGSNSGGTDRSLTITNTATTSPTTVSLVSLGTGLGATNNTIKNCNISTGSSAATSYGISAGGATPGTTGDDNDNLTIQNNSITKANYGIYAVANSTGVNDNLLITKNSIGSNTVADYIGFRGMLVTQATSATISENAIFNIVNSVTNLRAMEFGTGFINSTVRRNLIYNISNGATTFSGAKGMSFNPGVGVGTISINNNVIYGLNGNGSTTATNNSWGIMLESGTAYNIYFNSVNQSDNRFPTSSLPAEGCFYVAAAVTAIDLRNNAFSATGISGNAGGKMYGIYSLAPNTAFTTINYNDFYAPGTSNRFAGFLTSDRTTLADIQAGFGQNLNSFVADPIFNSNTNLVPQLGSPLLAVGDNSTGITIDYNAVTRTNPPTIGAYDVAVDGSGPTITYTPLTSTCNLGSRTLTATITDPSGVPTAGLGLPVLYWRINAGAWTAATGSFISGNNYSFTFGNGVVATNVVQYYIVAQDAFATPNVSAFPSAGAAGFTINPPAAATPPTTPSSYSIQNLLAAGTYTVGAAGTYPTITAAINAYNTSCLGGPIVFSLIDAAYTTTSDTIRVNADASAVNTLTIKPAVTSTITGNTTAATFVLLGADFVTIDGSITSVANTICPLRTSNRDLTIANSNVGTASAVIWLTHNGADGANDNTIKNCNITGNAPTTTLIGIGSGGASIGIAATTANNSNNSYINNNLSKLQIGVYTAGISAALKNNRTTINQNLINTVAPNNVSRGGIAAFSENNISVSGNNISEIALTNTTDAFGINLGNLSISTSTATGVECTNAVISNNVIGSVRQTNTYSAAGILLAPGATGTSEISNNMISGVSANGTSGDFTVGIFVLPLDGSTTKVYYNTVSLGGTQTGGSDKSYDLAIAGGTTPTVDVKNNIFINKQNNGTGVNYAIGFGYSAFTNISSNNNDLFVSTGATYSVGATSSISAPVNQSTLANWQTATTQDANSLSVDAVFVSPTNLHLNTTSNATLDAVATPVSVTIDIDCEARNATTPDIGADEFVVSTLDLIPPTIVYTPLNFTCTFGSRTLTATITDVSGVPTAGAGLPVLYWRINAGAYTPVTGVSIGSNQYTFTFGAGVVAADVVSYYIVAQDNAGTPNVGAFPAAGAAGFTANPPAASTPPTTASSYSISPVLNGTYTVGAAGTYPTITAAINAYNTSCLGGPVVFSLIDAAYTTTSDTIRVNADASAVNTLTIKPAVTSTITGNTTAATFVLLGADFVTIDGSITSVANTICPLVTSNRNLTIANSNVGTASAVIWLTHNGADGANDNTIKNCNITGNAPTTTLIGIGSGGVSIGVAATTANNNNNSYINNNFSKLQLGVYSAGISAVLKNARTTINQNLINTVAPNNVSRGGIAAFSENNISVSGNNISEIALSNTSDAFGINLGNLGITTATTTGVECTNAVISNNVIGSVRQTNTYSAMGILLAPGATGTSEISNNMISGVSANGTFGDFTVGIFVLPLDGSTTKVYYNTVSLGGTQTGGSEKSYDLAIAGGTTPTVDVKNNIFINKQNNGTGVNYAIGFGYTAFTNILSNNNDLFVSTGATYSVGATSSISAPVDQSTLANWQTATTKDANSLSVDAVFVSPTNLHLNTAANATLNAGATPVSVTTDIDCQTRDASTPDIGADEFIYVAPTCAIPTAVAANAITTTGATVSWTGPVGTYILEYGLTGFTPGTAATAGVGGTLINPATSPQAITSLQNGTAYDVYIRQDCTGSSLGYSSNSSVVSFTTLVPPPANDNCATATVIPCGGSISGNNTAATDDVLDPLSCGSTSFGLTKGVWFSITPTTSGPLTVSTCTGTAWDTYLRVYTGSCGAFTTCAGFDDDGCSETTFGLSSLTFTATAGTTYNVLLSGFDVVDFGAYTISVTCPPVCTGVSTWTGNISTDWNNVGNWICGIPTITSEVVIPTGRPNYPVINTNVEIKKITVDPSASVTVTTGFGLKLNGF